MIRRVEIWFAGQGHKPGKTGSEIYDLVAWFLFGQKEQPESN